MLNGQTKQVGRPETVSCDVCGKQIKVGPMGPIPRFCSPSCQGAAWRENHREHLRKRAVERYAAMSDGELEATRLRSRAYQRALAELADRYPGVFRQLYDQHLAAIQDEAGR